jgi:hypothetical protein
VLPPRKINFHKIVKVLVEDKK